MIDSETIPATKATLSPKYSLTLSYTRSHGNGKSKTLIGKANTTQEREYTSFFDAEGTLDEIAFIAWLKSYSESVIASTQKGVPVNGGLVDVPVLS